MTTTYYVGNLGQSLGKAHTCGGVKPVNGFWVLFSGWLHHKKQTMTKPALTCLYYHKNEWQTAYVGVICYFFQITAYLKFGQGIYVALLTGAADSSVITFRIVKVL